MAEGFTLARREGLAPELSWQLRHALTATAVAAAGGAVRAGLRVASGSGVPAPEPITRGGRTALSSHFTSHLREGSLPAGRDPPAGLGACTQA